MVEAAGVEVDGRSKTGLLCEFPRENEVLETPRFTQMYGVRYKTGTRTARHQQPFKPFTKAVSYHTVI